MSGLCQLPPDPPRGCCDGQLAAPAAPVLIDNMPGLSAIAYRIGTFSSFRRAMLDRVAAATLLDNGLSSPPSSPPNAAPNPFAGWREGTDGDYHTLFIELWAYLADILTFYQERIANEAYIGTATQRDSLMRLAQLVDYRPGAGAGASGVVAFTLAKSAVVSLPAGFRVGSRAQPDRPAAVFETSAAITARDEHSAIRPAALAVTNQFAPIAAFRSIFGLVDNWTPGLVDDVYGASGATFIKTLPQAAIAEFALPAGTAASLPRASALLRQTTVRARSRAVGATPTGFLTPNALASRPAAMGAVAATGAAVGIEAPGLPRPPGIHYQPFRDETTRTIVLQGVGNRLAVGDYVLVVENEHSADEYATPYQLSSVAVDKSTNTTTITWQEPAATTYDASSSPVALYALRTRAGAFGNNAPNWYTLSPTLTNSDHRYGGLSPPPTNAPYQANWDDPSDPTTYLPRKLINNLLALDSVYDNVSATADNPGWVILASSDGYLKLTYRFVDAKPVTLTDYALSTKVTQLMMSPLTPIPQGVFGIRDTLILTGAEPLALQNNLPVPDPLQGDSLVLQGLFPNLQDGQSVVVQGDLFGVGDDGSAAIAAAELRQLDGPARLDVASNLTTVKFRQPLANQYVRATTTLMANVVAITQGETVKDEVLGSGDGSALQSYALQKSPLTYLPSVDPSGGAPVASQLIVTVNGERWTEQTNLAQSCPDAKDFTATRDDAEQTTIVFGDGVNGARPPTGKDNIHARYRRGLGVSGNVPAGGVQQLIDNLAGVQQASNPQPTIGGTDAETAGQIRGNAPNGIRTFDRAVSPADYAALARSFPGIAKANAAWLVRDADGTVLAQPYVSLTVAAADGTPTLQTSAAGQLRQFLDVRRDPNVALRIQDFTPLYVDVALTVDLKDGYPRQATFDRVQAALGPGVNADGTAGYFAFANLDFGESLHLSAVYAEVMRVQGVRDVNITTFRRMDMDADAPSTVRTDILIGATEIAVIGNDPAHPEFGRVVITQGSGGFVDT
jgi:uncharacterized phage protein gp47/JayE